LGKISAKIGVKVKFLLLVKRAQKTLKKMVEKTKNAEIFKKNVEKY